MRRRLDHVQRVIIPSIGELPLKEGGGTFTPSGFARDTEAAEVHANIGFTEKPVEASLELSLSSAGFISAEELNRIDDEVISVFCSSGKEYVMPGAWCTEAVPLKKGEISVTFKCAQSERIS